MHYIGIDIAKAEHTVGAIDEAGKTVIEPFKVKNNAQGLERMLRRFEGAGITKDASIGMEATGHYWLVIFEFLAGQGFEASVINPIQTNAFRDVLSIRKTKTDAIDCMVIAGLLRFGGFEPSALADEAMMDLKQLTRFRTALVMELTALKNKASAVLDRVFPEYCTQFSEPFGEASKAVLARFPTPEEVLGTDIRTLARVLAESSRNRFGRSEAESLKGLARASVGVTLSSKALSFEVKQIVCRIAFTEGQIADLEKEIGPVLEKTKGKWLVTIPGIAATLASVIAAEVGDARRFEDEKALMAFAGMGPSKMQSGNFDSDQGKMSKRGSPHLRRALMLAADSVRKWDPYFGDYYDRLIAKGKHHYVALSGVARKLCAVVLALMKEGRAYEKAPPKRS
jgi:transposase